MKGWRAGLFKDRFEDTPASSRATRASGCKLNDPFGARNKKPADQAAGFRRVLRRCYEMTLMKTRIKSRS
ncbi:hypothetical protein PSP6_160294 [Paraburkholderia tropica]|nr:hypothetical protein PSP6_160294 [Paraburkholderia tropica]